MKTSEEALTEWASDAVIFESGVRGNHKWTRSDLEAFARYLNGEVTGFRSSTRGWLTEKAAKWVNWQKAETVRNTIRDRHRNVTAMELARVGSLRAIIREMVLGSYERAATTKRAGTHKASKVPKAGIAKQPASRCHG